jgi:4-hydroxyphenylpyruvate dioxygenase
VSQNPIGLDGMEFIEYVGPNPQLFTQLFDQLGMIEVAQHKNQKLRLFRQNDINFILNEQPGSFAQDFKDRHGPSVCATGFRVLDAQKAFDEAVARGAKPYDNSRGEKSYDWPAIYGIGDSLVYFVDKYGDKGSMYEESFQYSVSDKTPKGNGFLVVDHMTNNVPKGELDKWAQFYESIFNFKEIRFFDIKGSATGLLSRAMRSPCGKITIPINEPTEDKSQIQEYIDEYRGSGIQHIALLTDDICASVKTIKDNGIPTLDVPDTYYEVLQDRVPNITEDLNTLKNLRILADGDDEGYLLQIFSQNLIGPIFYEFIQRKNHGGFGEGNFQALFEAIERDQKRRGVL